MTLVPPTTPKKKGGKRRRGAPWAPTRGVRMKTDEEMAWGTPIRLSKAQDLSDGEILEAMIADIEDAGWVGFSAERADYGMGAYIPMALIRDIHLFVRRALRSRSRIYYGQPRSEKWLETPLGVEFLKIENSLRSDVPSKITHYSEYVKYFLYGYKMFGLDGGDVSDRAVSPWVADNYSHESMRNGFIDWLRDEYRFRREKPKIYFDPERGHYVFPAEQPKFSDISFREVLRRRRYVPAKNDRKSAKLIERLFQSYESIRVVRLDIGVHPGYVLSENPVGWIKWAMKRFLNYASKRIGPFAGLVGRIAKFQYSISRGYYCHIMFFYEDSPRVQVKGLEERIGILWSDKVMKGVGVFAPMSKSASKFRREPRGAVGRFDREARTQLLKSIRYMCISDEFFRLDLPLGERKFLASDLPLEKTVQKPVKRGNDRIAEFALKPMDMPALQSDSSAYSNCESPLTKQWQERLARASRRYQGDEVAAEEVADAAASNGAASDAPQMQGEDELPSEQSAALDSARPEVSEPGDAEKSRENSDRSRFRGYKVRKSKSGATGPLRPSTASRSRD